MFSQKGIYLFYICLSIRWRIERTFDHQDRTDGPFTAQTAVAMLMITLHECVHGVPQKIQEQYRTLFAIYCQNWSPAGGHPFKEKEINWPEIWQIIEDLPKLEKKVVDDLCEAEESWSL